MTRRVSLSVFALIAVCSVFAACSDDPTDATNGIGGSVDPADGGYVLIDGSYVHINSPAADGAAAAAETSVPLSITCKALAQTGYLSGLKVTALGKSRNYNLSIPPTYDGKKSFPVVFVFHGDGGDGNGAKSYFNFEAAHGDEAIFVYPDGAGQTWDNDTWDDTKNGDVQMVDAIVKELKTNYCVQPSRFYLTGFSRGGFFTSHMACMRGGVFAAGSPQGGGGPYDGDGTHFDDNGNLLCPAKPIPMAFVIGTADSLYQDAKDGRDHWLWANTCQKATTATPPAPCVEYKGCARTVRWCEIPNQGHSVWASGGDTAWQFFMSH